MRQNKQIATTTGIVLGVFLIGITLADLITSLKTPNEFSAASNVVMTIAISVVAIIFALYFIYVQIYVNRYPAKLLGKLFGFPIKLSVTIIGILVAYGISLILYPNRFFGHIFFWITTCLSIVYFFVFVIGSAKHLSINTCVIEYVQGVQNSLATKPEVDEFKRVLNELYSIYEECVTKGEYYVCQMISESTKEMFNSLLKEHNRLIIDKDLNEDDAIKLSTTLMNHSFKQIACVKNINSPQFVATVTSRPTEYISTCISIGQYTLYKKSLKRLSRKIYYYLYNDSVQMADRLFYQVYDLVDELIAEKDHIEWLIYLLQTFSEVTLAFVYAKKECGGELFAGLIQHTMERCMDIENEDYYKDIFDIFSHYTTSITRAEQNLDDIRVYFVWIAQLVIEKQNVYRIDLLDSLLDSIQKYVIGNRNWVEFFFYYISKLSSSMPLEYGERMRKKNISVLLSIISSDENPTSTIRILLPDYEGDVERSKTDIEAIKNYANEFRDLCHRAIVKDNTDIYYVFLECLNRSILCLPKSAKDSQLELFSVYYTLLGMVSSINNQLFPEMTISMLRFCIDEPDKSKNVSRGFAAIIITKMQDIASRGSYVSDFLTDEIIELFRMWYCDEDQLLSFLVKDSDTKQLYYKTLYSIGTSCIEYSKEESLRKVSNTMGWSFIRSLERKESGNNIGYLLKLITSLYKIAVDLNISKQTLTFLMTLFTTVGTYCESDAKYFRHQNGIVKFISQYEMGFIRVAAQIRTGENSNWDDLFKGKTEVYTNKFLDKVQKAISERERSVKE